MQTTVTLTREAYDNLKRAEVLQGKATLGEVIEACVETHLEKHDPVRKAERSKSHGETLRKQSRRPAAAEIHKVNLRDKGRCTFVDENGERCDGERWVEHHHIKPFAQGGSNDADNLTTLCSFHHDLIHQMDCSFEGQISWFTGPHPS